MWIGEHRNHFKLKVKHMMERLIKKFGFVFPLHVHLLCAFFIDKPFN